MPVPGPIALLGSGETSSSGRKVFERLMDCLPPSPRVALLETPAGFELNASRVVKRVADFLCHHLQNYNPQPELIPARQRGTRFSPDDPEIAAPLLTADLIFMGPGSPTYAVRQLRGSHTWDYLQVAHRRGAALALASAAVIAISAWALPVYEIYKVGEDLHWKPGLDLLAPFGLSLVFVPHWDNREGGEDLDTRYCFMGKARFDPLLELLPPRQTVVGIDEHTTLWIDIAARRCEVLGRGVVTRLRDGQATQMQGTFPLDELGKVRLPGPEDGILPEAWEAAQRALDLPLGGAAVPPTEVLALVDQRQSARAQRDWATADKLREQIQALGWRVRDTPDGPQLKPIGHP